MFTIETSSTTMNWTAQRSASANHLVRSDVAVRSFMSSPRFVSSGPRTGRAEGDTFRDERCRLGADFCEAPVEEAALWLGVRELERALVFRPRLVCTAEA